MRGTTKLTSPRGTRGGPAAISAALVPECILRPALTLILFWSPVVSLMVEESPNEGDFEPICISVGGGGLGSRGEFGGKDIINAGRPKPSSWVPIGMLFLKSVYGFVRRILLSSPERVCHVIIQRIIIGPHYFKIHA